MAHTEQLNEAGAPTHASYSDRVVGFVDILGFEELVKRAHSDPGFRGQIVEALSAIRSVQQISRPAYDLRTHSFSDSLILSAVADNTGVAILLASTQKLIANLLSIGVFVRGAVTIGGTYHDDHIVFGVGVNEAYRLENSVAKVPRVILGSKVVDRMKADESNGLLGRYLTHAASRGQDGVWHLDPFQSQIGIVRSKDELRRETERLKSIQHDIQRQIDGTVERPDIYAKIEWVAKEWNENVSRWVEQGALSLGCIILPGQDRPA